MFVRWIYLTQLFSSKKRPFLLKVFANTKNMITFVVQLRTTNKYCWQKHNTMTAHEIFEQNQVLTYEAAKTLIGKRVATTHYVSDENEPYVSVVKITGFATRWDYAATQPNGDLPTSLQDRWMKVMSKEHIEESKNCVMILGEDGSPAPHHICIDLKSALFSEPTAICSDYDRKVYFSVLD